MIETRRQTDADALVRRITDRVTGVSAVMTQLAAVAFASAMTFRGVKAESAFPSFNLKTIDGQVFDSAERFRGRAGIISFFRANQEQSEKLLGDLQAVHEESSNKGLQVVAICSGEVDRGELEAVIERLNLRLPVLLDPGRAVYGAFGVIVVPATWFVDDLGTLRFYQPGYRRDFPQIARADAAFLLGEISAGEREALVKQGTAPVVPKSDAATARYNLGLQLMNRGRLEMAEKELREAWQGEPRIAAAGIELGYLLLRQAKEEEALKVFSEAVEAAPNDIRAKGGKAVTLLRTGHVDDGENLLKEVLDRKPDVPLFYYEMGVLSEKRGDTKRAAGYFKSGLEAVMRNSLKARRVSEADSTNNHLVIGNERVGKREYSDSVFDQMQSERR